MVWKITRCRVAFAVLAVPLLLAAVCFVESLRYPRIARSAYWRRPNLLVRATAVRLFPGKGVSEEAVAAHAARLGYTDDVNVRLLYLPELPADDKTIKDRVFGLIRKERPDTDRRLFWIVTPYSHGNIINDHTLAYEYKTGRLVCAEDVSMVGESTQK
ncbi:MAG: hypothetical protein KAY65_09240 [Planctomycetes bacterium]|nr:hypothetical protein [Planctomycetota bacterium]